MSVTVTSGRRGNIAISTGSSDVTVRSPKDDSVNIKSEQVLESSVYLEAGGIRRPLNNIYAGPTPPSNPTVGTVWIDTSLGEE